MKKSLFIILGVLVVLSLSVVSAGNGTTGSVNLSNGTTGNVNLSNGTTGSVNLSNGTTGNGTKECTEPADCKALYGEEFRYSCEDDGLCKKKGKFGLGKKLAKAKGAGSAAPGQEGFFAPLLTWWETFWYGA